MTTHDPRTDLDPTDNLTPVADHRDTMRDHRDTMDEHAGRPVEVYDDQPGPADPRVAAEPPGLAYPYAAEHARQTRAGYADPGVSAGEGGASTPDARRATAERPTDREPRGSGQPARPVARSPRSVGGTPG